MSLIGKGALLNWHDVKPEAHAEFNAWHTHEHQPERLSVPGFLRARRYAVLHGQPQYFILYETEDAGVLGSPPYLERLNLPTPWTRRMFEVMTRTIRCACSVEASIGTGVGGLAGVIRLDPPAESAAALREVLVGKTMPATLEQWNVTACHLLRNTAEISGIRTIEKEARGIPDESADWIVVVEGVGRGGLEEACKLLAEPINAITGLRPEIAFYGLQNLLTREEVSAALAARQPS